MEEKQMSWIILLLAGFFEIAWAIGLKLLDGFEKPFLLIGTLAAVLLSMLLLSFAMKHIPLGTAYAIWTGIGILGTFLVGVLFFQENISMVKAMSVVLILLGVAGLKLA